MENQIITIVIAVISSGLIQFFFNRKDRRNEIFRCLLKNALYQEIERAKSRGYKTHAQDCDFCETIELYKGEGNGNSVSILKEWDSIPIKED